ncbi:MAG: PfaD family polyunsaturated fatty acid/polyketide biosynthesis protein [Firmicutes bacterium]|nr:PfaD family polyunsaturated fatty acid/polyketide biosynthesis protein [Bacillota bacterium]
MLAHKVGTNPVLRDPEAIVTALEQIREPLMVVRNHDGAVGLAAASHPAPPWQLVALVPPLYPEWLGDPTFGARYHLRFPYIAGEMAGGIATPALVIALGRLGMLGFFGAGGLSLTAIRSALTEIRAQLDPLRLAWGTNLIHNPANPREESRVVDLYLTEGVPLISASAYLAINANVVRLSATGLKRGHDGQIQRRHHLFAKLSRPELARQFLAPAPDALLRELVQRGALKPEEADLARQIPVAEAVTVEADSGGHTDNRPLSALFPAIFSVYQEFRRRYPPEVALHIGAAGGLGTPEALAAAFSLGAAYVMTGSVNQTTCEAGVAPLAKEMLARATIADVTMAPAADMFELGVRVQVLRRGTFFPQRADFLYQLYTTYQGLADVPEALKQRLEAEIFRAPVDAVWAETEQYFRERDPAVLDRAARDEKFRMALVFRWYLAHASRWAATGVEDRREDYQLWCGPALGAFNDWVRGSFLEPLDGRTAEQIALNLMEGTAVMMRVQQLRLCGLDIPWDYRYRPRPLVLQ